MMVTFISQCEKNALKKTRRVLDAFANRIGDNTWQTVITDDGLKTVRKMLRQSASKNTAVSCHWLRSRSRSQLLWTVGNRAQFDAQGYVPVNRTRRNLLKSEWENDWHQLPLIQALSAVAALFHDWGKANQLFQNKLDPKIKTPHQADPLRHEWISCLLLISLIRYFQQQEKDWLEQLSQGKFPEEAVLIELASQTAYDISQKPLTQLPVSACYVLWLIVSHHRLPVPFQPDEFGHETVSTIDQLLALLNATWNGADARQPEWHQRVMACFQFSTKARLGQARLWRKSIKRWCAKLHVLEPQLENVQQERSDRQVLHHARLCLMLADHFYSSQPSDSQFISDVELYANTKIIQEQRRLDQHLDEHLCGVMRYALRIAHFLPSIESELPITDPIRALRKASPAPFDWQDKAAAMARESQQAARAEKQGYFLINMASTGCGKTRANAKIMRALSDDGQSLRFILALGLRTLTLQTGDEYRDKVGLNDEELAVLIGSKAVRELHEQAKADVADVQHDAQGSASAESLFDGEVDYDGLLPQDGFATVLTDKKSQQLLYAPVLVCTIDHVMGATETKRGGRYILPALRLMSSDLVIDEIDDFSGSDLIAIARLVHLAGMLGRKVMLSSATIPPALAEGFFYAYQQGWQCYVQTRNASDKICCLWIDEFKKPRHQIIRSASSPTDYRLYHDQFIDQRVENLSKTEIRRKAVIAPCPLSSSEYQAADLNRAEQYFGYVWRAIEQLHQHHHLIDSKTQIEVSFGVVRMANIKPCVALTQYLLEMSLPDETDIRVMAYHSHQVLLMRHTQEQHLDGLLKRKAESPDALAILQNKVVRRHLGQCRGRRLIFVLVATPVEEVGRDHDFDWAVIEPSSYRSIVQLAGRVRRHRPGAVSSPNLAILQYNFRAFIEGDKKGCHYFIRPGYERDFLNGARTLKDHDLQRFLDAPRLMQGVDASDRIKVIDKPRAKTNLLAFMEHTVLAEQLTNYHQTHPNRLQGYLSGYWYLSALPQRFQPFRKPQNSEQEHQLYLRFDDNKNTAYFCERDEQGDFTPSQEELLQIHPIELSDQALKRCWIPRDYRQALTGIAERTESTLERSSEKYGELRIQLNENDILNYHDQLGLFKPLRTDHA